MKRFLSALIILSVLLSFTGCGQKKANTVPEKMIEWLVEDFVQQHKEHGGEYTNYTFTVDHDPDKGTNTDTLSVVLTISYPFETTTALYSGVYQFDRASEKWSVLRGGEWTGPATSYNLPITIDAWLNSTAEVGYSTVYTYDGTGRNPEEWQKEHELLATLPNAVKKISNVWNISYWSVNANSGEDEWKGSIHAERFLNRETALQALDAYCDLYQQQGALIVSQERSSDFAFVCFDYSSTKYIIASDGVVYSVHLGNDLDYMLEVLKLSGCYFIG